jgi:hypothetical protein
MGLLPDSNLSKFPRKDPLTVGQIFWHITLPPERHMFLQWRNVPMSDHQLKFKGPNFEFDARGWIAIGAAIIIVLLVLLVPHLFY